MRLKRGLLFFTAFFLAQSASAAGLLDINYLNPSDLSGTIPQNVANEAIKLFGIYTVHRPYTGATSIGHSNTLDILVEATLVKLGPGLVEALQEDGIAGTPPAIPAVPMAKISLRKAFGENVDLGFSGLYYRGGEILGGDLKIVLHDAEEGPSFAIRLGYTYADIPYAYFKRVSTFSPELVMSRRLYFAEPYLGMGGRYITGTVSIPFEGIPIVHPADFIVEKQGSGITAYAFTGVFFRILGAQGLRIGIEGTFDISGYSTMGLVFGIGF
jgi:hypothetical protein